MASPVPVKLQPLHNFSFTHLKWKNHRSSSSGGRSRLAAGEASSSSPPPPPPPATTWRESSSSLRSHTHTPPRSPANGFRRPSPMRDSEEEFEADHQNSASQFVGKTSRRTITESTTKSIDNNNNNNNNNNHKRKRSNKISIRIRENNSNRNDAVAEEHHHHHSSPPPPMDDSDSVPPPAPEEESSPKIWNLRPRRPPMNHKQSTGGGPPKIGTSRSQEIKTSNEIIINKQSPEVNISNNSGGMRRLKKQKFSIPLSRGEIEEDILLLTGSKPSRRPKKRPRAIQKQLDNLFPGLWLDSITADSYKVSEASTKG